MDFNPERMAVHAGTFVPERDIGKAVGGFYLKYSKYIHGRIVPSMCTLRKHSFPLHCTGTPVTGAISGSAGLEARTGMRAVAKRFTGRVPATAQGPTHFYAFLPELVVQFHTSAKRDRTVLDA